MRFDCLLVAAAWWTLAVAIAWGSFATADCVANPFPPFPGSGIDGWVACNYTDDPPYEPREDDAPTPDYSRYSCCEGAPEASQWLRFCDDFGELSDLCQDWISVLSCWVCFEESTNFANVSASNFRANVCAVLANEVYNACKEEMVSPQNGGCQVLGDRFVNGVEFFNNASTRFRAVFGKDGCFNAASKLKHGSLWIGFSLFASFPCRRSHAVRLIMLLFAIVSLVYPVHAATATATTAGTTALSTVNSLSNGTTAGNQSTGTGGLGTANTSQAISSTGNQSTGGEIPSANLTTGSGSTSATSTTSAANLEFCAAKSDGTYCEPVSGTIFSCLNGSSLSDYTCSNGCVQGTTGVAVTSSTMSTTSTMSTSSTTSTTATLATASTASAVASTMPTNGDTTGFVGITSSAATSSSTGLTTGVTTGQTGVTTGSGGGTFSAATTRDALQVTAGTIPTGTTDSSVVRSTVASTTGFADTTTTTGASVNAATTAASSGSFPTAYCVDITSVSSSSSSGQTGQNNPPPYNPPDSKSYTCESVDENIRRFTDVISASPTVLNAITFGKAFFIGDDDETEVSEQGVSISVAVSQLVTIKVQYREVEREFTLMHIRNYDPAPPFEPSIALSGMTISHGGPAEAKRILVSNANVGIYIVPGIDVTSVTVAATKRYQDIFFRTTSSGTNGSCFSPPNEWCSRNGANLCGVVDRTEIDGNLDSSIRSRSYFGPVYVRYDLYHSGTDVSSPSRAPIVFALVFLFVRVRSASYA